MTDHSVDWVSYGHSAVSLLSVAPVSRRTPCFTNHIILNHFRVEVISSRTLEHCDLMHCMYTSAAGMSTDAFADFVVGHGELWCAQLLAAACRLQGADAKFMDTREVLVRLGACFLPQLAAGVRARDLEASTPRVQVSYQSRSHIGRGSTNGAQLV